MRLAGDGTTAHDVTVEHLTTTDLEAGLDEIRAAPTDAGTLELIVRRPAVGEREVADAAELSIEDGLVGDNWRARGSRKTEDGSAEPSRQLTIMSARAIALLAGDASRWPLAGDQLFVDLDLSHDNLPAGTVLAIGSAVVEVTEAPHNGCAKFADRYGMDAVRFVNSPDGKALRLRGLNARVVEPGTIRAGDTVKKLT
jgi:MOSC domain-containing protein YiiM